LNIPFDANVATVRPVDPVSKALVVETNPSAFYGFCVEFGRCIDPDKYFAAELMYIA
jgi:hypothetical protein